MRGALRTRKGSVREMGEMLAHLVGVFLLCLLFEAAWCYPIFCGVGLFVTLFPRTAARIDSWADRKWSAGSSSQTVGRIYRAGEVSEGARDAERLRAFLRLAFVAIVFLPLFFASWMVAHEHASKYGSFTFGDVRASLVNANWIHSTRSIPLSGPVPSGLGQNVHAPHTQPSRCLSVQIPDGYGGWSCQPVGACEYYFQVMRVDQRDDGLHFIPLSN